jgi:hypothetical protein
VWQWEILSMVILARAISIALLLVLAVRPALAADWQCGRNAGSDEGGRRAAAIYTLIQTAKLNDIDPQAGSPTCSPACRIIRPSASMSCCPGIGVRRPEAA